MLVGVDFFARVSYGLARTPVLPLYAAFLGAGPEMIGIIGAAATITGIVLKLPAGTLSDIIGRRPMLLFGLLVFATGPLLILLAESGWGLAGIRFYHGLATAVYGPVAMAAVASLAGDRRGEYLSWLSNTKILGKLLGAFLGGLLLAAGALEIRGGLFGAEPDGAGPASSEFRRAFLVSALLGAIALVLGLFALQGVGDAPHREGSNQGKVWRKLRTGVKEVSSDIRVLLASGCEGIQNLTVGIIEHFLPLYAVFIAGHTPFQACLLYASQAITTIVAKPLFGRWSDRRGRRGVIILGMFACAAPFAAIPWVVDFQGLLWLCLVFGLGEALVTSSSAALVTDLCRRRSFGAAMGVFGTIKDTGHASGPILGGGLIAVFQGVDAGPGLASSPSAFQLAFGIVATILALYAVLFMAVARGNG